MRLDADRLEEISDMVFYIPISCPYRYPNQTNSSFLSSREVVYRFELLRASSIGSL